jgi:transposase
VKSLSPPMARYKPYDYCQTHLIPVSLEHQLLPRTLEYTIHVLVDHHMDLSLFDGRYKNDETGCPAYNPKILLKVVLFAYSRGIIGSRRIEWLCRNNIICMALACLQHPDHSTIAAFVSSMQAEILSLFCDVLLVCEEQQLLGGTVFALDGLKLPSNASKAWSGTIEELQHKQEKLEAKLAQLLDEHQQVDAEEREGGFRAATPRDERTEGAPCSSEETPCEQELSDTSPTPPSAEPAVISPEDMCQDEQSDASQPQERQRTVAERPTDSPTCSKTARQRQKTRAQKTPEQQRAEREARYRRHITRLEEWLATHDKKIGRRGKEIKSNVIDNDSAKMATSHGVIQGYNAQALVDDKHQIIVVAEAFGDGQDAQNLTQIMPRAKATMQALGHGEDGFHDTTWLADSSYFSDGNLETCDEEHLNAYIPDDNFRKRDPQFANQDRYKPKKTKKKKKKRFGNEDFTYDEATQGYRCPNGKILRLKAREHRVRHRTYRRYVSDEQDCQACPFRAKCLSKKTTTQKHLGIPVDEPVTKPKSRGQLMMETIDSPEGKQQYSRRLELVEPVFGNIRIQKGLDHFTLRGKEKVDIQWLLYGMVHNIEKIAHYGNVA